MTVHLKSALGKGFRSEACESSHTAGLLFALLDTPVTCKPGLCASLKCWIIGLPGPDRDILNPVATSLFSCFAFSEEKAGEAKTISL
jgi:hypothetical protein